VVRHGVFLDEVGASYLAWQRMASFEDMTKPFGLARKKSTRKCFAENDCITTHGDFWVLLLNLCLNDLGSNQNLLFGRLPLARLQMPAHS
jgi:hypothetical protein